MMTVVIIIVRCREDKESSEHALLREKLALENDSLKKDKLSFMIKFDSIQHLATKQDSIISHGKIKTIYLINKKDEKIKILTNATPTQRDSFMESIHIKAISN